MHSPGISNFFSHMVVGKIKINAVIIKIGHADVNAIMVHTRHYE